MAMQDLDRVLGNGYEAKVPDLDWASLEAKDVDNIPTENPVEVVPQLVEQWSNRPEVGTRLSGQVAAPVSKKSFDVAAEVDGVVERARREMMMGVRGDELGKKLASLYPPSLIREAAPRLKEAAEEQGLLGNVYVDLSCFDSCREAAEKLGPNRVRLAQYVVGEPRRKVCSSHHEGYCKELGKRVVSEVPYGDELFAEYTKHLRVAGKLAADESVTDKETLRDALLRIPSKGEGPEKEADKPIDVQATAEALGDQLLNAAEKAERTASDLKFAKARPILAYVQGETLKGRMGKDIVESLGGKFSSSDIKAHSDELRKVASLQGLLGNVYIDVGYYKTAEEAIQAIKGASTDPSFLVNSHPQGEYDTRLEKVARATGCVPLPMDGKFSEKVAAKYITNLRVANRLSRDASDAYMKRIQAGESLLAVLQDAFKSASEYRPEKRVGGVQGSWHTGDIKGHEDRTQIHEAAQKALESGVSLKKVQSKIASFVTAGEAAGIVQSLLYKMPEVDANCLDRCVVETYPIMKGARLKKASKCGGCVNNVGSGCMKQGAKFAGEVDLDKAFFDMSKLGADEETKKGEGKSGGGDKPKSDPSKDIEPHMKAVLQDENPDVEREDMKQPYDVSTVHGSGGNKTLDAMREADKAVPAEKGEKKGGRGKKVKTASQDPSAQEMRAFLKKEHPGEEGGDFDIEAAIYWYANDFHGGQASDLYSALSTSKFKPGPAHKSVKDEGEVASMMYESLKREFGGK